MRNVFDVCPIADCLSLVLSKFSNSKEDAAHVIKLHQCSAAVVNLSGTPNAIGAQATCCNTVLAIGRDNITLSLRFGKSVRI